jgi:hypothetical protein
MECQEELERLDIVRMIPERYSDVKPTVHAAAFGTLEAMLNFIGQQLSYFRTRGGKPGFSMLYYALI